MSTANSNVTDSGAAGSSSNSRTTTTTTTTATGAPSGLARWLAQTFGTPTNLLLTVGGLAVLGAVATLVYSSMHDGDDDQKGDEDADDELHVGSGAAEDVDDEEEEAGGKRRHTKKATASSTSAAAAPSPASASVVSTTSSTTSSAGTTAAADSSGRAGSASPVRRTASPPSSPEAAKSASSPKSRKRHKGGSGAAAASHAGSTASHLTPVFPPASTSRDVRRYENVAAGFCFDYPHMWKCEPLNTPHMPVRLTCRKRGATRESSRHAPAVLATVEKVPDDFDLTKAKAMLKARSSRHITEDEDFKLVAHDDGPDPEVDATIVVLEMEVSHGNGVQQMFRQWQAVAIRCRKMVSLQLVMPREIVTEHRSEVHLFKSMARSLYIAPTVVQLDLNTCDILEYEDAEYVVGFTFPAVFRQSLRPKPGVLIELIRESDAEEEKKSRETVEVRVVPLKVGASVEEFSASARSTVHSAAQPIKFSDTNLEVMIDVKSSATPGVPPVRALKNVGVRKVGAERSTHVQIVQVCVPYRNNRGFLVTFTCMLDDAREFEPIVQHILKTFHFDPNANTPLSPVPHPSNVLLNFRSPTRGVCMQVPSSWKATEEYGSRPVAASFIKAELGEVELPEQLNSQVMVHRIQRPEKVRTLAQLETFIREQTMESFPTAIFGEPRTLMWDGRESRELPVYCPLDAVHKIRMLYRMALVDTDEAAYLQFACVEDGWSSLSSEVQCIFNSTRLVKPEPLTSESSSSSSGGGGSEDAGAGASSSTSSSSSTATTSSSSTASSTAASSLTAPASVNHGSVKRSRSPAARRGR